MTANTNKIWSNWSGSLKFSPGETIEPSTEDELQSAVKNAVKEGKKIRVVGAGHSSPPLVYTRELFISLKNFTKTERGNNKDNSAWVGAGLTVKESGKSLLNKYRLSLHNTGDVDVQTLAGAISTGTHGTGIKLKNLSSMLVGCRMITAQGELIEYSEEEHGKEFFDALRLSLGTFGIMTSMKLKLLPAFKLERKEWCTHTNDCLAHLDELVYGNRNFDFYWYPRNDLVKLRTLNEPGKGVSDMPYASCIYKAEGWAIDVLPRERALKFDEMEYALPFEAGPECFREVRKIIKEKFRKDVAWRVLYRTIAADDFLVSPFSGRDSVTISLHQNAGLPFWHYFKAIEPVFLHFGGRPHWGKKHTLQAPQLRKMYQGWDTFNALRKKMDPHDVLINPYLKNLLG